MNESGFEFTPRSIRKRFLIRVTPRIAQKLLDRNTDNPRRLYQPDVNRYASDMANGRWSSANGVEPIKLSRSGKLINGQHRLTAIVQSGITVDMWLETGLDDEAARHLDQGRVRSHADLARISHPDSKVGDSLNIQTARLFGRMIRREWGSAVRQSYASDEPLLIATCDAVEVIKKRIHRSLAPKSTSAPVKAAMVFNYLLARDLGSREAVLELIDRWCNRPGKPPTPLHTAFDRKHRENPSGQEERLRRFMEATPLFDPNVNQRSTRVMLSAGREDQEAREKIRRHVIAALGDAGIRASDGYEEAA